MAASADGTGSIVPLALYPPGFDLSNFLIYDPAVCDWVSGATYARPAPLLSRDGPLDNSGDDPDPGVTSGFYRVWHIPDWAFNITNNTYDSSWFFPVDFADYRDKVDSVQLLIDGEPSLYSEFMPYDMGGGEIDWGMGIDFDRLANGTHQLQLVTTLRLNDDIGDSSVLLVLSNKPVSVVVANLVTFPDWDDYMQGDTYTFKAQLANPDTDWTIDIYDVWGQYVNSGSGHTYNGQVSWTWDQYDWMGNYRDGFDNDPYFYAEITFDSGSALARGNGPQDAQTTKPTPPPVKGYPDRGEWLVAYCDRWYSDAWYYTNWTDVQPKYIQAMNAVGGGPILIGDTAYMHPLKFGTNVYTQAEREQTWTNLLNGIGNLYIRNFYYHGHGGAKIIGSDRHIMNTNGGWDGGTLTSRDSKSAIYSWQISQKTKYNRYRFVFLDGCSTAAGDLPNAFNVSKTNHTISFYENHPKHPRPSVFVGWNQVVGGEPGTSAYKALDFRKNWMGIWANGSGFPSIKKSLEDANSIFGWLPVGTFNDKIRFFGYQDMKIRDYNRKADWRWN